MLDDTLSTGLRQQVTLYWDGAEGLFYLSNNDFRLSNFIPIIVVGIVRKKSLRAISEQTRLFEGCH